MTTEEMIRTIATSEKRTPVKLYVREKSPVDYGTSRVFGTGDKIVFGDWRELAPILRENADRIADIMIENDMRNSAVPLLDIKDLPARIEPGAIIRDTVTIGKNAVIMMGAILNVGACVGEGSMIDMGAVLGGRVKVGRYCHIGAGAVLAGVIEPACVRPVVIEDHVLVGANAVVIEGVRVGEGAVAAAGAVVISDVPPRAVVAGCPAKIVKYCDEQTAQKTALQDALRCL